MPPWPNSAKQKHNAKVASLRGNRAISQRLAPDSAGGILRASIVQPRSPPGSARVYTVLCHKTGPPKVELFVPIGQAVNGFSGTGR